MYRNLFHTMQLFQKRMELFFNNGNALCLEDSLCKKHPQSLFVMEKNSNASASRFPSSEKVQTDRSAPFHSFHI